MTPPGLDSAMIDRALDAYRVPDLSRGFADRVVAEAARPGRQRAVAAPSRAARRPWMRRRLIAGVVLLNLLAASAIAAVMTGHAPLATLASLSRHLFSRAPVEHVAKAAPAHRVVARARPAPGASVAAAAVALPHPAPSAAAPIEAYAARQPLVVDRRIAPRALVAQRPIMPHALPALAVARPRPIAAPHRRVIEHAKAERLRPDRIEHARPEPSLDRQDEIAASRRANQAELDRERPVERQPALAARSDTTPRAGRAWFQRRRFDNAAGGGGVEGAGRAPNQPGFDRAQRRAEAVEHRRQQVTKPGGKRGGGRLGRGGRRRL